MDEDDQVVDPFASNPLPVSAIIPQQSLSASKTPSDTSSNDSDSSGEYYSPKQDDNDNDTNEASQPVNNNPIIPQSAIISSNNNDVIPKDVDMMDLEQDITNQLQLSPNNDSEEEDIPLFGPFVSSSDNPKTIYLPSLKQVLNPEQRIALCGLCFLIFDKMIYRYARYEYFGLYATNTAASASGGVRSQTVDAISKKSGDNIPLIGTVLTSDDDDYDITVTTTNERTVRDTEEGQVHHKKQQQKSDYKLPLPPHRQRQPFPEEMCNPETIEDVVFFQRPIDGNVALAYALRTLQEWSEQVIQCLYEGLDVSFEERMFVEQSIPLGLTTASVCKPLIPTTDSHTHFRFTDLLSIDREKVQHLEHFQVDDVRPFVLWNMLLLLLQQSTTPGRYDARARAFMRQLAVGCLNFGSFLDFIEQIEAPVAEIPSAASSQKHSTFVETLSGDLNQTASSSQISLSNSLLVHGGNNSSRSSSSTTSINRFQMSSNSIDAVAGENIELPESTVKLLQDKDKSTRSAKQRRKRALKMAAAAVGGGVIIGVSAGLAAPILGAGLASLLTAANIAGTSSFLAGVGGTALITSGAVISGGSIAGFKMEKRTRGVEVFHFIPIKGNKERASVIISISGWVLSKRGKGTNVPLIERPSTPTTNTTTTNVVASTQASSPSMGRQRSNTVGSGDSINVSVLPRLENMQAQKTEEVLAVGLEDLVVPFMGVSPMNGSHYALAFDPHILCRLGDALRMFASELISFSTQQLLQQTVLSMILAPLTWPLWLVKLGYLVDNPWSLGLDRARKAGYLLADALCNNLSAGRPVTLVGYSLGARVIWYALLELASRGKYGIVDDVYLFGAPILIPRVNLAPSESDRMPYDDQAPIIEERHVKPESLASMEALDEVRKVLSVVGGRFVNCFSRTDWVLGFLFRVSVANIWNVAGLGPIVADEAESARIYTLPADPVPTEQTEKTSDAPAADIQPTPPPVEEFKLEEGRFVHNVDITALVPGHISYRTAMPKLLKKVVGFACWSDDIEVIEDIVGGEWMDEIDGWWKEEQEKMKGETSQPKQQ